MALRRSSAIVLAAVAALALAGCGQSDIAELRGDQMQIREMIASQNQQIQELTQQLRTQHSEIEEISHGSAGGQSASDQIAALEDRLNKLEASVSAMQTGTVSTAPEAGATPPRAHLRSRSRQPRRPRPRLPIGRPTSTRNSARRLPVRVQSSINRACRR